MTSKVVPSPLVDDNPCWGGPEPNKHDLEFLLQVLGNLSDDSTQVVDNDNNNKVETSRTEIIKRVVDKLVIYQDDNYIAIHKPADLRMDGPYRATLHKLLLYLYPPPSLLNKIEESNDNNTTLLHKQLLQAIAPLSTHADVKDDPFRMVHQLDYATSGVLLVGKSKKSTAVACKSFEQRKTKKHPRTWLCGQDRQISSIRIYADNMDTKVVISLAVGRFPKWELDACLKGFGGPKRLPELLK